jgi:hypothetical protein
MQGKALSLIPSTKTTTIKTETPNKKKNSGFQGLGDKGTGEMGSYLMDIVSELQEKSVEIDHKTM